MLLDPVPLLSFACITMYTPGPNNISCTSLGMLHGYRGTLGFILGISLGAFVTMLVCAFASHALHTALPQAQEIMRFVGAGYILWLAWAIYRSAPAPELGAASVERPPNAFAKGLVLQFVNPKALIFGLTLYSTFLAPLTGHHGYLLLSAVAISLNAFISTSSWALFGSAIGTWLGDEKRRRAVNTVLALLLVYTAVTLTGLQG